MEPEILEQAYDLKLDIGDAADFKLELLLPTLEDALADLVSDHPELEGLLPEVPTNLQEAIDQVMSKMDHKNEILDDGTEFHSYASGNGWLETDLGYEQALLFQPYTPVVFFFSSEGTAEASEAFADRWTKLRKDHVGAAYYRIDIDQMPGVAEKEGVITTPYFKVLRNDEFQYTGDGSDWTHFRDTIATAIKLDPVDTEGYTRSPLPETEGTDSPPESFTITEDLAESIAEAFGYSI